MWFMSQSLEPRKMFSEVNVFQVHRKNFITQIIDVKSEVAYNSIVDYIWIWVHHAYDLEKFEFFLKSMVYDFTHSF